MTERDIERILSRDYSVGTEAFREALLARCLAVLPGESDQPEVELYDEDLELLAAAGDAQSLRPNATDRDALEGSREHRR